jgi:hypothetical protein
MDKRHQKKVIKAIKRAKDRLALLEYQDFVNYLDAVESDNCFLIESSITDSIRNQIDFIRNLSIKINMKFDELVSLFKMKAVFMFFRDMKWSFENIADSIKKGYDIFKKISIELNDYLNKYKEKRASIIPVLDIKTVDDGKFLTKAYIFLQKRPFVKRMSESLTRYFIVFLVFGPAFFNLKNVNEYKHLSLNLIDLYHQGIAIEDLLNHEILKEIIELMIMESNSAILSLSSLNPTSVMFMLSIIGTFILFRKKISKIKNFRRRNNVNK